jgi:uncharacterized protein (TIGR03382 family)
MDGRVIRRRHAAARVLAILAVAVALAGLAGRTASGETVFEQPPDPGIYAGVSSTVGYFGDRPGARTADDFVLASPSVIRRIDWWGQHAPPSSGLDDFTFRLYQDAGGLPGALLLETRGTVTSAAELDIPNLTFYRATLAAPLVVPGGVTHWLSIYNASPGAAWRWDNSQSGNEVSAQSPSPPDNAWTHPTGTDVDLGFRLDTVPEPGGALLAVAVAATGVLARRRRSRR